MSTKEKAARREPLKNEHHGLMPLTDCRDASARTQPEQRLLPKPQRKWFATAQAQAALRGIKLDLIEADSGGPELVLTRWCFTRSTRTLDELRKVLSLMGVQLPEPPGDEGEA